MTELAPNLVPTRRGEWRVRRVFERGKTPTWYAVICDPEGRDIKRKLGPSWRKRSSVPEGYLTKRGARRAAEELLRELSEGYERTRRTGGVTVEQAANAWLRYCEHDRKRTPDTMRDYRSTVRSAIIPALGKLRLADLTAQHIDRWRRSRVRDGNLSDRTINKHLTVLHGILAYAQRAFGLSDNPAAHVEHQPRRQSNRVTALSVEDVEAIARHAPEPYSTLVLVAALTGLRWGELRQLRWDDIDYANQLVHVRHKTKSHRARSVPLMDRAAQALARHQEHAVSDLVFTTRAGNPLDHSYARRTFHRAREAAGVKPVRLHDLRHTFATHAVKVAPLTDVKTWMGHADIQTTMIYAHHIPARDAADRLSQAFRPATSHLLDRTEHAA